MIAQKWKGVSGGRNIRAVSGCYECHELHLLYTCTCWSIQSATAAATVMLELLLKVLLQPLRGVVVVSKFPYWFETLGCRKSMHLVLFVWRV